MRKDLISFARVRHVLLDSEIVHRNIEVQRGCHCDWGQVRRAMTACPHMINLSKSRGLLEVRQASAMHDRHAKVVDELLLDENMRVPNCIEDLADRERSR